MADQQTPAPGTSAAGTSAAGASRRDFLKHTAAGVALCMTVAAVQTGRQVTFDDVKQSVVVG